MTPGYAFWQDRFGREVCRCLQTDSGFRSCHIAELASHDMSNHLTGVDSVFVFGRQRFAYPDTLRIICDSGIEGVLVDLNGRDLLIGPRLTSDGPCLSCCSRRYLGAPGDPVRLGWEVEVARGLASGAVVSEAGFDRTIVALASALCLHHLESRPSGAYVRLNLLTQDIRTGVAISCDDCTCGGTSLNVASDLAIITELLKGEAS